MELVQQHGLPDPVQGRGGVCRARPDRGGGRPQLGLAEQVLAAAVALLGLGLGGVGAAVHLEVELPDPDGRVGVLRLGLLEERVGPLDLDPGRPVEVAQAGRPREHLARGAAPAVTPAEGQQRAGGGPLVGEVAGRVRHLGAGHLGAVGVGRREVREDAGAVEALPPERVVREAVGGVPGDLLGEEPLRTRQRDELGQGGGVAERVGQPHLAGLDAELVEEEPLAVVQLPGEGLAAGHVGVGLDPHAAHGHEAALAHPVDHPGPDLGAVLLEPGELLGRGHGVDELGVVVHQGDDVGAGAGHLAHRLAHRPQPGGVDVGVADRREAVGAGPGGVLEHPAELAPRRGRRARDVADVEEVEGPVDGAEDLPAPGVGHLELGGELAEHLEVLLQLPDLLLEDRELGALDAVAGLATGGVRVSQRRRPEVEAATAEQQRVGRRLHEQLDLLAACGRVGHPDPLVARVQPLHR